MLNPPLAQWQTEVQDSSAWIDPLPQVAWTKECRLDYYGMNQSKRLSGGFEMLA